MKTLSTLRILFTIAAMIAGITPVAAHGQYPSHTLSVNVPFGFELGSKHLGPGVYTITTPLSDIVSIRNSSDGAMIMTHPEENMKVTSQPKLVFHRYGDRYFLSQVWFGPEQSTYLACPESKAERRAKREEIVSNPKEPSNVEVAFIHLP